MTNDRHHHDAEEPLIQVTRRYREDVHSVIRVICRASRTEGAAGYGGGVVWGERTSVVTKKRMEKGCLSNHEPEE